MKQIAVAPDDADYLTYEQTSALLSVKKNTLYAWVSRKVIPFVRLSPRVVRFRRTDLEQWLRAQSVAPRCGEVQHA